MISGVVRASEGRIRLMVRGASHSECEIEAIIDTGYTGSLTLPPEIIASLHLRWKSYERGTLADGSVFDFDVYDGFVSWDGQERKITINEADAEPLLGMALLNGYELKMQVRSGGKVTIKRLPSKKPPKRR